jgi:hypothetical protein
MRHDDYLPGRCEDEPAHPAGHVQDEQRDAHPSGVQGPPARLRLGCPCAYVGGITEPRIVHTSGVRQRDLELNIVVVDELQDNEETSGRIDVLTDALLDALTAAPHAVSALTVQQPVRVEAGELDVGGVIYAANVIVVSASIQEGRT